MERRVPSSNIRSVHACTFIGSQVKHFLPETLHSLSSPLAMTSSGEKLAHVKEIVDKLYTTCPEMVMEIIGKCLHSHVSHRDDIEH